MHIQFELGLQKLGSLSKRKFLSPEIDNLLNRSQDQFIADSIKQKEDEQGFQEIQIDVDRIRTLVTKRFIQAEFIKDYTKYREYNVTLPSDYSYLISDSWNYAKYCATTSSTINVTRSLYQIPFPDSEGTTPYYADMQLHIFDADVLDDTLVDLAADLPGYGGYTTLDQKFLIPFLIQSVFYRKSHNGDYNAGYSTLDIHYERFKQYFYPGSFLVTLDSNLVFPALIIDGDQIDPEVEKDLAYIAHTNTTYKQYTSRLVRSSKIDNILGTEYYKPILKSPVSTIDGGTFRLYSHISQIVNSVTLSYIRQPQKIDLLLQLNSELAPEFHQKIVDMAVQYAAGRLEQEKLYQITTIENKLDK